MKINYVFLNIPFVSILVERYSMLINTIVTNVVSFPFLMLGFFLIIEFYLGEYDRKLKLQTRK